jgi:hypothetical protein
MTSMIRGSLKPDLSITIADASADANFAGVTADMVTVTLEQHGAIVAEGPPDTVTPAAGGKSAVVKKAWGPTDTSTPGRMWVSVTVDWPGDKPQTFPADGPLRLDIIHAPGDA